MEQPDLYAVLGVAPSATAMAITSAFRRRARELRPDTRVDALTAERFGEARAAYETLRDPVRRAAYDRARARERVHERAYRWSGQVAGTAGRGGPPHRYVVAPGVVPRVEIPEPPLRAGPVHWEHGG